jgi:hypothetical protein
MDDPRWIAYLRHMRRGDFESAWKISDEIFYERRGVRCHAWPRHLQWLWDGGSLDGKRILIRCYHGLGDTVQFIRYAPMLAARAKAVTIWTQPALTSLIGTMPGVGSVLPLHDGTPEADFEADVEVMELPYIFRTTIETVPARIPYFFIGDSWPRRHPELAVGVAWRAGPWDRRRDVPFPLITRLAEVPGVRFYILQQRTNSHERHKKFHGAIDDNYDALDTARLMRQLDLVISVDSLPAHLAGALGVPTWTLLIKDADWRWMENRDDSPWYPTMRLFRQTDPGDWSPVIARVAAELRRLVETTGTIRRGHGLTPQTDTRRSRLSSR